MLNMDSDTNTRFIFTKKTHIPGGLEAQEYECIRPYFRSIIYTSFLKKTCLKIYRSQMGRVFQHEGKTEPTQ